MNKKISPTLIGAFVIGAVALLVIAVIVFGSGRLFRQTREFVLYFDNSVNGLRVGAPVKFKGVEVGSVKRYRVAARERHASHKNPGDHRNRPGEVDFKGSDPSVVPEAEAFRKAMLRMDSEGNS